MEKIIDRFERVINKSVRELTENDLIEILQDENYHDFFKDPDEVLILLKEIFKLNKDAVVRRQISLTIYSIELVKSEATLDATFNSYSNDEITRETLESTVKEFISSDDTLLSLIAVSCALLSLENINLSEYEEKIKDDFNCLKEIFNSIGNTNDSYLTKTTLLNYIFQIREEYYIKYSVDLLDNLDWIEDQLKEIHNFEDEYLRKNIPTSVDITPEQLGYIDITKLKDKGD